MYYNEFQFKDIQEKSEFNEFDLENSQEINSFGLYNLSNTCYFNSVIQALFHISNFRNFFIEINKKFFASDLLSSLSILFYKGSIGSNEIIDPSNFHKIIKEWSERVQLL